MSKQFLVTTFAQQPLIRLGARAPIHLLPQEEKDGCCQASPLPRPVSGLAIVKEQSGKTGGRKVARKISFIAASQPPVSVLCHERPFRFTCVSAGLSEPSVTHPRAGGWGNLRRGGMKAPYPHPRARSTLEPARGTGPSPLITVANRDPGGKDG